MPAAVTRSRRDSPDPFSSTSPGIAIRFSLSHFCTTSAASAGVAGGGCFAVASVRKIWRAITLFESLFTSRTMSYSGADSIIANGFALRGGLPSITVPENCPPRSRKYVVNMPST